MKRLIKRRNKLEEWKKDWEECDNHKWIAPEYLRIWRRKYEEEIGEYRIDLPMICKNCGTFNAIMGINWNLIENLIDYDLLQNIEFDTEKFHKLIGRR